MDFTQGTKKFLCENGVYWEFYIFMFCEVYKGIVQQNQKNKKKLIDVCAHFTVHICYT